LGTAVFTVCPEMLESLEVAAFTLPVSDLVLDEFEGRSFAEIRNREYRLKYRLQTDVIPLFRNEVHLQKAVIRFSLDFDEVRNLRRRIDLREIHPFGRLARSPSETVVT